MYAIAFDLVVDDLRQHYHNTSYQNAYGDVKNLLAKHGFSRQQGSLYYGGPEVDAVKCVLAAMALATTFPWFSKCVKDIRMLRIEENNDLMPAIVAAAPNS